MLARTRPLIILLTGAVLGFSVATAGGALAERRPDAGQQTAAKVAADDARLLAEVLGRIRREYVDDIDEHQLLQNAVRGMVAALDPHSAFLDEAEFEEIRLSTMGAYPGVGIEVVAEDSAVKIVRPMEGSPAEHAGLRAGDLILKIDGEDVGADLAGAIARMRGDAGTKVTLTVRRPSADEIRDFTLERTRVEVHSVASQPLAPGYGYVRIMNFTETTAEDLDRAVARLKDGNGGRLDGLVLDLRNNPGGVLEAGVAVADAFLDRGVIVTAEGRTADARFRMDAAPGDLLDGASLVVLVNGGSASASEIVAGALKDHGRAELIGHKTYGKGSVQTIMPLARGGAVKLTTSRYFTPSGTSIQGKGITPDLMAAGPEQPPADASSGAGSDKRLLERDGDIRLALETLQSEALVASAGAGHAARPVSQPSAASTAALTSPASAQ